MQSTIANKSRGYTPTGGIATALAALTAADAALSSSISLLIPSQTGNSGKFLTTDGSVTSWATAGGASGANPSGTIGLTAVNGSASTFMRSDGAPALSQSIAPTMTAAWTFSKAGAASTPAIKLTGVPFAGTGTTSLPLLYIADASATASTTLNAAGTYFGVNGDGTQDLMNLMKDGVSQFKVASAGNVINAGTLTSAGAISTTGITDITSGGNVKATYSFQNTGGNFSIESAEMYFRASYALNWTDATTIYGTRDTGIKRNAAGIVEINNGTATTFRDLKLRSILLGTSDLGSGVGVVAIANATTVPTVTPTGGGVMYSEAGALKWRGSSGTITTLAAA